MRFAVRAAAWCTLAWAMAAPAQEPAPGVRLEEALRAQPSEPGWHELTRQGLALRDKGEYDASLEVLQRAHGMVSQLFGEEHENAATSLRHLAEAHRQLRDYPLAERLYRRALAIVERIHGPGHRDVGWALNNLAVVLDDMGRHSLALPLLHRSLDILERQERQDELLLPKTLMNLGNVYSAIGEYAKAESAYKRAQALIEAGRNEGHGVYPNLLMSLGKVHEYMGDGALAGELMQRALDIEERTLGPRHPEYGTSLNNVGNFWIDQRMPARAEPMFRRSLAILEAALGKDNSRIAAPLTNLADALRVLGRRDEARSLNERSLAIVDKTLGADHFGRAVVLRNLARLSRDEGDMSGALRLFQESLAILQHPLGPNHPDVPEMLAETAAIAWAQGRLHDAGNVLAHVAAVHEHITQSALAAGNERQQRIYLDTLRTGTDIILSFHLRGAPHDPSAARLAATTILQRKGRVLEAVAETTGMLRRKLSPEDLDLLDRLRAVRAERARLAVAGLEWGIAATPPRERELDEKQRSIESRISERGAALADTERSFSVDELRAALPPDAVLVEWIAYRPLDHRAGDALADRGAARYAAYVFRRQGEPIGVDLADAQSVDGLVARFREAMSDPARTDATALARQLDALLLQPLRPYFGRAHRLLLSPDGSLNLIPFAALRDRQGRALLERHSISYLGSGRELLRPRLARPVTPPLLLAAPDFEAAPPDGTPSPRMAAAPDLSRGRARRDAAIPWPFAPLPATHDEAKAIRRLVPGMRVHVGSAASKAALHDVRGPAIVHIATHGFFVSAPRGAPQSPENGLLLSGLALAGANRTDDPAENGILTALEAASLDLWGTQLVVLSACDTGVGSVHAGEGVYSLRRALAMAGSQTQVVSLWKVDDEATRDLMTRYYSRLVRGEDRVDAMRRIQLELMRRARPFDHPYYWAGFIVAGARGPVDVRPAPIAGPKSDVH